MTKVPETLGQHYLNFLLSLRNDLPDLPQGIEYLNPYRSDEVMAWSTEFYTRFFNDPEERTLILGINPGRLGGGQTGIAFTDPVVLEEVCGIRNSLQKRRELSSSYIYEFIQLYGGPETFYRDFFISSVCPLGFVRDGKNLNFYDDKKLLSVVDEFVSSAYDAHSAMPFSRDYIVIIGKENTRYFERLNSHTGHFSNIVTLEHPRFILQYRRKKKDEYLKKWMDVMRSVRNT